ncbi:hypothetical protein BDQ17DRAFT_1431799 [Cyathus striatus]|nr:hypothetical protein BDQ17DRAFT_1431799 [Cyathus striatus]
MYSDSSDSETELDSWKTASACRWPHLRLHDKDESHEKCEEWKRMDEMKRNGAGTDQIQQREKKGDYRIYRVQRFFDSLKGFYTGSLDLTGRHLHRFEALLSRWNAFLPDFDELSSTIDSCEVKESLSCTGQTLTCAEYKVNDAAKWEQFKKKWRVPKVVTYDKLVTYVKTLQEELQKLPSIPKIQQLCLVDLPAELLDSIFASVSGTKEAKSFSSTCKLLREIGIPFIFSIQTITLDMPNWPISKWMAENKTMEEIRELALAELDLRKHRLLTNVEFLLSKPVICGSLRCLSINNSLTSYLRELELNNSLPGDFYRQIGKAFADIIRHSKILTRLSFSNVDVTEDILQSVVSLPHLVELSMTLCSVPEQVLEKVFSGEITPSPTILNLELQNRQDASEGSVWDFIAFCSNLRTLSIFRDSHDFNDLPAPSDMLIQHHKLFSTLRRMYIGPQLNPMDIIDLTQWIHLSAMQAPLQITHLKLTTSICIEDRLLFPLLDALRSTPLQVLVLDGVSNGSFDLFDRIAVNCPRLLGLTVNRREISQRHHYRLVIGPMPPGNMHPTSPGSNVWNTSPGTSGLTHRRCHRPHYDILKKSLCQRLNTPRDVSMTGEYRPMKISWTIHIILLIRSLCIALL